MTELEKFEKIKEKVISDFVLKRNLYIFLSFFDVVACITFVAIKQNYYLIILFAAVLLYLLYEVFIYNNLLKKDNYMIVEMCCNGASRSYFGYSLSNSKIFNFQLLNINSENASLYYNKWNEENEIKNPPLFEDNTDLQFVYEMKLSDVKKSRREENLKFQKGDIIYGIFSTNKKKPLTFNNSTLLFAKEANSDLISDNALSYRSRLFSAQESIEE